MSYFIDPNVIPADLFDGDYDDEERINNIMNEDDDSDEEMSNLLGY